MPVETLTMPKWGLTMKEGTVISWLVQEGAEVAVGEEICEVETEKATSGVEATAAGTLRRFAAAEGDVVPVGGLLAVLATADVSDDEIQAFIAARADSLPEDLSAASGPRSEIVAGARGDIHLLIQGTGPETVVLLHGFGGDAENWRFVMTDLAQERTVVAVDLPGHGGSTKNVGDGTVDELVDDVSAAIQGLGITRTHVVGHSLGGLVASRLADRDPERVASLVLIAPAGVGGAINTTFLDGFIAASSRREVKAVLRLLFAREDLVSRQLVEEVLRYKRLEGVPEALTAIRDATLLAPQTNALSTDVPVLLLWGAQDEVIEPPAPLDASSSARSETVQSGHSPHVEQPAVVREIITEFLSQIPTEVSRDV